MKKVKILSTADWHLGQFNGPVTKDGCNARFQDICKCLDQMIEKAHIEQPDFILVAGDIFHNAKVWADRGLLETNTAIMYIRQLKEIAPVVVMLGTPNHDGKRQFEALSVAFDGDHAVRIVTEPKVVSLYNIITDTEIEVACLPGFDRGYFRSQLPGVSKEDENEVFTQYLHQIILGLWAQCSIGKIPCVLMGHYTIAGADMESGQTAFFGKYEPIIHPDTLNTAEFNLNLFGHIHKPQKVQTAPNTFYSGAISALNFNDEGQQRGFYIHEIADTGKVESRFEALLTREFQTIRLTDEDVETFLNNPMPTYEKEMAALVYDKIVRVRYNCTDERNKKFNHAVYEKYLYDNGAFFVQEITPEHITVAVDKKAMDAELTPVELLDEYLKDKVSEDKSAALKELAVPVIKQVMEQITREHNTGMFVPVEIAVKNYRNYREEKFSFEDTSFCVINGHNGAGKSSLFMDAMIDCLFEQTREGDLTGWICNDPAVKSGSIMFTFRIGKNTYRVTRTRCKSGKATLNLAQMVDGEWENRSREKMKDTQTEIEKVLEMDAMTLKACALIMQDQYGVFMEASPEDRMNILANLLGLKPYEQMAEIFSEKLTDANRDLKVKQSALERLTEKVKEQSEADLLQEITAVTDTIKTSERCLELEKASADALRKTVEQKEAAAVRAEKIRTRISGMQVKWRSKDDALRQQETVIRAADVVIEKESDILNGVSRYHALLEKEKEMISGKAAVDQLTEQMNSAVQEKQASIKKLDDLELRMITAKNRQSQIKDQFAGMKEPELAEQHQKYADVMRRMEEINGHYGEYAKRSADLDTAKQRYDEVVKTRDANVGKLEQEVSRLRGKIELLKDSGCPMAEKATCRFLQDALLAKEKLPEAEDELKRLIETGAEAVMKALDAVNAAKEALKQCPYSPDAIAALAKEKALYAEGERQYQLLDPLKAELKEQDDKFTYLSSNISDEKKVLEAISGKISGIHEKIAALSFDKTEFCKLKQDISDYKVWLTMEKQLSVEKEKRKAALERKAELEAEINEIKKEIAGLEEDFSKEYKSVEGCETARQQLREASDKVTARTEEIRAHSERLGFLKRKKEELDGLQKEISSVKKQIEECGTTAIQYEVLKKAFSSDGIPHNIVRSVLPVMEAKATSILAQMSNGRMSVEFVTEKVLKTNSKKEITTLDIIINDVVKGRLPYLSKSGGEKVKASLAVILSLAELKKSRMGIQTGFLFLDEPAFLDAQGIQAYCDALVAIQERYPELKVMAITHDESFKGRFPQSVDVVDGDEGSKVICN